jgi:putative hydrolase of the HAD superfamily
MRQWVAGQFGATRQNGAMSDAIDAVLFDLDDTLLDGEAAWRSGVNRVLLRCPEVAAPAALQAWETAFAEHYPRYLAGEMTQQECQAARIRSWAALLAVTVDAGTEMSWFGDYQEGYEAGWAAFGDVAACLSDLDGVRIGVVTNGDSEMQRAKLDTLGLGAAFEVVVASGDIGIAKPDPRIFHHAARQLRLPPTRCLYVGDRRDTDALAALGAGMTAVWLNRRGGVAPDGRVPQIATLSALPSLVRVLRAVGGAHPFGLSAADRVEQPRYCVRHRLGIITRGRRRSARTGTEPAG